MPTEAEIAAIEAADAEEEMFEEWANTQDGDDLDLDQMLAERQAKAREYQARARMRERGVW